MSRAQLYGVVILVLSVAAWLHGGLGTAGGEPEGVVKVTADDLATGKVVVVGKLGLPLTTKMTIRGTWQPPPQGDLPIKDSSLLFHVTHVNGVALAKPVEFHRALVKVVLDDDDDERVKPSDGETWEFQGYETGRFRVKQDPTKQAPFWAPGHFWSELFGTMPRPGKPAKKTDPVNAKRGGKDSR